MHLSPDPAESEKKRILLVDDHPILRQGLANVLNAQPHLTVCGEAHGRTDALAAAERLQPDLALVDLSLRTGDGIELHQGPARAPAAASDPGAVDARRDDLRRACPARRGARVRDEAGKVRPPAARYRPGAGGCDLRQRPGDGPRGAAPRVAATRRVRKRPRRPRTPTSAGSPTANSRSSGSSVRAWGRVSSPRTCISAARPSRATANTSRPSWACATAVS